MKALKRNAHATAADAERALKDWDATASSESSRLFLDGIRQRERERCAKVADQERATHALASQTADPMSRAFHVVWGKADAAKAIAEYIRTLPEED